MSVKNVPEISRIGFYDVSSFGQNDALQIFGENFTKDTKLYVWQAKNDVEGVVVDFSNMTSLEVVAYKNELREKRKAVNFEELDTVISSLPEFPPENAKVFEANEVFEHCIYFGDKEPNEEEGKPVKRIPGGTSIIWLENEAGMSKPQIANRPQIWNTSHDKITAGSRIMVFGDAFGKPVHFSDGGNLPKKAAIKNIETGECFKLKNATTVAYSFDVHEYLSEYFIPEEAPLGRYNLYVHSATCGRYGWSEPVQIEVVEDTSLNYYFRNRWNRSADSNVKMPQCEIITICADDPSPLADYADKIQSAIDSLKNGGVVALSYGTFPISKSIDVKSGVVLKGSGNGTVIKASEGKVFTGDLLPNAMFAKQANGLRGWANDWREHMVHYHPGVAVRLSTESGVEDLKIKLGDGLNIGVLVAGDDSDRVDNAFINGIEVDSCGVEQFPIEGKPCKVNAGILCGARTNNLVIFGCKCYALQPIQVLPARHTYAKIINNEFYCRPKQVDESVLAGLRNSIVSNNVFADGRRSFVTQGGFSHNWVFQNRSIGVARADCAEESYMSEHGESEWSGRGVSFGENFVEIECEHDIMIRSKGADYKDRFDIYQRYLFIINGRGFAQCRKIIDVIEDGNRKKLILDKPWVVIPDETSAFAINFGTHNNLWVDNNNTFSNGPSQFIWGVGFDNVISGHIMEMAAGIVLYSWPPYYFHPQTKIFSAPVVAFNKIMRCQTKASGRSVSVNSQKLPDVDNEMLKEYAATKGVFGNIIRNCHFDGSNDAFCFAQNNHFPTPRPILPGVSVGGGYNRITCNYIYGYSNPIQLTDKAYGNYVSMNDYRGEKERFTGDGIPVGFDTK